MPSPLLKLPLVSHRLDNGLRLIVSEAHELPIAAAAVCYEVGSVDEEPGKSGFAHLFEHLMFQGSANVPRNGHFKMVQSAGGSLNAFTTKERTVYYQAVPSHQWKLPLWLEADRMRSLQITAENFQTERSTVKEERRLRYDNQAYGMAHEVIDDLAHDDPAYRHSVIGSMADLDRASLDDVQAFWQKHYSPSNATLVVTGDVRAAQVLRTVTDYFGDIPRRTTSGLRPARRIKPRAARPREKTIKDGHAKVPALYLAFPCPKIGTRSWHATGLLLSLLTHGESSRLHRRLVKQDLTALHVQGNVERSRGPGVGMILALVRGSPRACRASIESELDLLMATEVSDVELRKAKNKLTTAAVHALGATHGRALQIAVQRSLTGRDEAINTELDKCLSIDPEEVRRAARDVFAPSGRAWLSILPGNGGGASAS